MTNKETNLDYIIREAELSQRILVERIKAQQNEIQALKAELVELEEDYWRRTH